MGLHDLLPKLPSLSHLSPSEIDALAKAMVVGTFDDKYVFDSEAVYLLMEGQVVEGLNEFGPGAFFGLLALLDAHPRKATYEAKGTVVVASMNHAVFSVLFGAHAPISIAFQHALAVQLAKDFRSLDRQIQEAFAHA